MMLQQNIELKWKILKKTDLKTTNYSVMTKEFSRRQTGRIGKKVQCDYMDHEKPIAGPNVITCNDKR